MGKRIRWIVMISICTLCAQSVWADLFIQQRQKIGAFSVMGQTQPAQEILSETWITPKGFWTNSGKQGMILSNDGKMTILDHEKRTYMEMPTTPNQMADAMGNEMDASERAELQQFMGKMMEMELSVRTTGEKKTINGYKCEKYIQNLKTAMGNVTTVIWATTDIDVDAGLYTRFSAALMANQPGMQNGMDRMAGELRKIKGVQVLSKTTQSMMGSEMKSSVELLKTNSGKAPSTIFTIPKEYQKTTFGQ